MINREKWTIKLLLFTIKQGSSIITGIITEYTTPIEKCTIYFLISLMISLHLDLECSTVQILTVPNSSINPSQQPAVDNKQTTPELLASPYLPLTNPPTREEVPSYLPLTRRRAGEEASYPGEKCTHHA
jgi:hypothetical protein